MVFQKWFTSVQRAGLALVLTGVSFAVHSQAPQGVSAEQRRQIEQLTPGRSFPPSQLPKTPEIDLRILAPEKSPVPKAADELEFIVSAVEVDGVTYFSKLEMDALFTPLLNKRISLTLLRDAAGALEQKYRERGFFLVRVFIPPQQIKDGLFKVRVIEGHVSAVFVEGPNDAMNDLVVAFARQLTEIRPLDQAGLERVLLLINDLPGVSAAAVLRPGFELGASDLLLTVTPVDALHMLTANNSGSQTTGPFSLNYNATLLRPFNSPGQLNLSLTASGAKSNDLAGTRSIVARYSQALGSRGLMFSLAGTLSESTPGGTLSNLAIQSNSTLLVPRLKFALQRSRVSSVFLEGGVALNESKTTLAGANLTEDRTTVVDLAAAWTLNGWMNGVQNISIALAHGITNFWAMDGQALRPSTADFNPNFMKYTLSMQRTQMLPKGFSVNLIAMGQYVKDRLLVGERLAFGGTGIGRAYPAAIISGDKGVGGVLELRRDLNLDIHPAISNLQVYFSTDSASVSTNASLVFAATHSHLSSQAVGFRFNAYKDTYVEVRMTHANQALVADDSNRSKRVLIEAIKRF